MASTAHIVLDHQGREVQPGDTVRLVGHRQGSRRRDVGRTGVVQRIARSRAVVLLDRRGPQPLEERHLGSPVLRVIDGASGSEPWAAET